MTKKNKKVTDNEIINHLRHKGDYIAVIVSRKNGDIVSVSNAEIANLIIDKNKKVDCLQAENEQKDKNYIDLLKTSSERADIISELSVENERLKDKYSAIYQPIGRAISEAKTEAYKEFAKKLENKIRFLENRGFSIHYVVKDALNGLLKELDGGNDA